MGSTDLFSEKFAMYFSTMNPLASKIYADIEGIEDYIKAHGPPSITYNEKCSIVDKFLIHDHLSKNDSNGKYNRKLSEFQKYNLHKSEISLNSLLDDSKYNGAISEAELLQPVFYNDSILDQDHESVLLASVAPKKPEKYVYDDNNYWIDEHSGTYSSCTPTQAKACKLQQFLDSLPPPPNLNKRGHDHPQKYRAPPIPTFCSSKPKSDLAEGEDSLSSYIVKPAKAKQDEDDDHSRYSRIDKKDSEKCKPKYSVAVPVLGGLFGDTPPPGLSQKKDSSKSGEVENSEQDLPNQVQNKDLIAELQAKLKKGKNPSESLGEGISPRSSTKLNKPKAPPPPPPGTTGKAKPGGAVKVTSEVQRKSATPGNHEKDKKKTKESTAPHKKNSGSTDPLAEREISSEFVVDVSSPCKIVTQKTGLDFLDNW